MLAVLLAGCGTTTKNIPTASPAPRSAPAEPRVAGVDPAGLINRVTWGINPSTLHEAETSGIHALRDFAAQLKTYSLRPTGA